MANNSLISVVIPVYNTEKYLDSCIESVLAQTYKNIEIILVDDGSADDCGTICDKYASEYDRIVVIHQDNCGLSMARNNGSKIAKGNFISFIDSDDYVSSNYIEYLMSLQTKYNADVVTTTAKLFSSDKCFVDEIIQMDYSLSRDKALEMMCYRNPFGVSAWGKLYRRDLVLNNPYPEGKLHEDTATTYKIIGDSKVIAYGNQAVYYYYIRNDSIMNSCLKQGEWYGVRAAEEQMQYMKDTCATAIKASKYYFVHKAFELINKIVLYGNRDNKSFKELRKMTIPYFFTVFSDKKVGIPFKIEFLAVILGYSCATLIFRLRNRFILRK